MKAVLRKRLIGVQGRFVLLLGLGLLDLLQRDVEETAVNRPFHLHFGPDRRLCCRRDIMPAAAR